MFHKLPSTAPNRYRLFFSSLVTGLLAVTFSTLTIAPSQANPTSARTQALFTDGSPIMQVQSNDEWRRKMRRDSMGGGDRPRGPDFFRDGRRGDGDSYFGEGRRGPDFFRDGDRDEPYGRGHDDLAEGFSGLAAGAILGGIIADRNRRGYADSQIPPANGYAPGSPGYMRYCFMRYRSFDPVSFTFIGYDGRVRYCR